MVGLCFVFFFKKINTSDQLPYLQRSLVHVGDFLESFHKMMPTSSPQIVRLLFWNASIGQLIHENGEDPARTLALRAVWVGGSRSLGGRLGTSPRLADGARRRYTPLSRASILLFGRDWSTKHTGLWSRRRLNRDRDDSNSLLLLTGKRRVSCGLVLGWASLALGGNSLSGASSNCELGGSVVIIIVVVLLKSSGGRLGLDFDLG